MNAISVYRREANTFDAGTAGSDEYTEKRTADNAGRIVSIETESISPNPSQPRKNFEGEAIARLADSIRRYGILQPLTVRRVSVGDASGDPYLLSSDADPHRVNNDRQHYELVAGERRLRAARLIGMRYVPCVVIDDCGRDTALGRSAELAIIENIQREDLNIFEQAGAIASLIEICSLTQEQAARQLSVSQSYIANKLRILRLTEPERKMILDFGLTERHARALLKLKTPEERMKVIKFIVSQELNVSASEEYIDRCVGGSDGEAKNGGGHRRFVFRDVRMFFNTIDRALETMRSAGFSVKAEKTDTEEGVELKITVPKT